MSETIPSRQIGRSIWALFAGFLAVVVLSIGVDIVLHALGIFPPLGQRMSDPLCAFATAYRTLFAVGGSYITARYAPYRPMQHALVGGVIGLVLSAAGAAATWNSGPAYGPHWYPIALIITAMPSAWAGGKLRVMQLGAQPLGQEGRWQE